MRQLIIRKNNEKSPEYRSMSDEEWEKWFEHRTSLLELSQEEYYWFCEEHHEKKTGLKDGAHVRYLGVDERFWHHCVGGCHGSLHLNEILDFETIYEIDHIVRRIAKLVGFRDVEFNSGIFEAVNKDEEKKTLKPGDRLRYIASEEYLKATYPHYYSDPRGVLDFEATYEVESVELSLCPTGYLGVKLVEFEDKLFNRRLFERI
jgi:hypothetical protein